MAQLLTDSAVLATVRARDAVTWMKEAAVAAHRGGIKFQKTFSIDHFSFLIGRSLSAEAQSRRGAKNELSTLSFELSNLFLKLCS